MHKNWRKIHFIAIGGSVMHSLAIALKEKGLTITGSDDQIFEPSKSRLEKHGLLPDHEGWNEDRITSDIDVVILGMHARDDNPELKKAKELGLTIYSFPEFIYHQSEDKQRVVIAGSHGKTTIASMVIHVLNYYHRTFDYAVGATIKGITNTVKLTDEAPIIIIEGDEYLSSSIDKTPKFLHYKHHIGLISGIAWDHINVFPTEDEYVKQFDLFADASPKAGFLIYCEEDAMASIICSKERSDVNTISYKTHPYIVDGGVAYLLNKDKNIPLKVFGKHNMQNISGAKEILKRTGISEEQFNTAIQTFEGANNRLEQVAQNSSFTLYKDYAHAPSKVKATTLALKEQYPERDLVACLELHTFSSLNKKFLSEYSGSLKYANEPIVYYNPATIKHKNLDPISQEDIQQGFANKDIKVFDDVDALTNHLSSLSWDDKNLVLMSSGNFDGLDYQKLFSDIT
ncbi:MAG: Mur ligase family protein [Bacteroidota bacterium]